MNLGYKYRQHRRDDLYLGYELKSLGERLVNVTAIGQTDWDTFGDLDCRCAAPSDLVSIPMQKYSAQAYLLAFC